MNRVILYVGEEGDWIAECMSPQCAGQAKTKQKALEHVKRAIQFSARIEEPNCGALVFDPDAVDLIIYEIRSRPTTARLN